ncbi:MAG: VWA domain-containing protein [Chloracidobacterium sp.]|nr:VWA domain-containing protein [Chloracidobacterium sp.]
MKKNNSSHNVPRLILLLFMTAFLSFSASAQVRAQEDKTLSPYFFVKGDPSIDQLPLKDTRVDIAVSGVIADVRVVQTYRNEGTRPFNATYFFPASTRAAVYSMRMKIGNQVIVAKIKEREKAAEEFETAKKEGKSASLLEESRPNVFSMKLANIMPNDQIDIELRYTELLIPTNGIYEVVYPTVVGPRYPSKGDDNAPKSGPVNAAYLRQGNSGPSRLHISTRISAGVPIEDVTCISHQITTDWPSRSVAQLILDDADPFQGNRDFVVRYRLAGDQIKSGLILFQHEDENFFLYMAQPPQRVKAEGIPPREFIFVVDVSGSMEGFPLDTAKQLLVNLIGGLRAQDYFNVVLFAGDSTTLSQVPLQANRENITLALDLLSRQRGAGGTELLPAVQQAMSLPRGQGISRSIVLITDGYISGEKGVFDHIRANLNQCGVFSFGIGSSVNRYLIEGVAKAGMGEPFIVTEPSEAAATAENFREYIQSPVLSDIKLRAAGFDVYDVFPAHIPDMLAQRPLIVFGKWRGPVGGTFELTGKTGAGDYSNTLDVAGVQADSDDPALRYLWARNRIAELSDYGSEYLADDKVKEITSLGLKYNLLTPYTSFIAVREKIVNPSGSADDVSQPLPLPLGVSDMAVGSEPELVWLFASLALIAMFLIIRRRRNRFTGPGSRYLAR